LNVPLDLFSRDLSPPAGVVVAANLTEMVFWIWLLVKGIDARLANTQERNTTDTRIAGE
jgi:hypothetical protein